MAVIFEEVVGEVEEPRRATPPEREERPRRRRRPEAERIHCELRRIERRRARLEAD